MTVILRLMIEFFKSSKNVDHVDVTCGLQPSDYYFTHPSLFIIHHSDLHSLQIFVQSSLFPLSSRIIYRILGDSNEVTLEFNQVSKLFQKKNVIICWTLITLLMDNDNIVIIVVIVVLKNNQ